ncbi:hypothetical protein RIF29_10199 [Crotalaria pallida]|uniref:Uncharacterized protein n=1 Tax=Crotalaria pallida TaxID=3830 RepID=A0AAN9FYR4_CROPI
MSNSNPIELDSTANVEDKSNSLLSNTRCSFCLPCCFGSHRSPSTGFTWWERAQTTSQSEPQTGSAGDRWWRRGFMKVREWSEIVAGPRWKTFIRRFNRNRSGGFRNTGKYQYDPLSYALNFDEGPGRNGDFEDGDYDGYRNFSTRYVAATTIKTSSFLAEKEEKGDQMTRV